MTQAYAEATAALHEVYESSTDQIANLVAAYRRVVGNSSNVSEHETEKCVSVGIDLQMLRQLAQFDKLLFALK
jgi:hypothetical protein